MEFTSSDHNDPLPEPLKSAGSDISQPFTITVKPVCDIWRKPPSLDVFNAPVIYTSMPSSSFTSMSVDISAEWKTLYDQGGLVLHIPSHKRWVKAGVEFENGKPWISVVVADKWADWSLMPLSPDAKGYLHLKFERVVEEDTSSMLKISVKGEDGEMRPAREVTGFFEGVKAEEECHAGVFAAKPIKDEGNEDGALVVHFKGLTVDTK